MTGESQSPQAIQRRGLKLASLLYFGGLFMWLWGLSIAIDATGDWLIAFAGGVIGAATAAYVFVLSEIVG